MCDILAPCLSNILYIPGLVPLQKHGCGQCGSSRASWLVTPARGLILDTLLAMSDAESDLMCEDQDALSLVDESEASSQHDLLGDDDGHGPQLPQAEPTTSDP